jgi:UDP-N-acetyl-D-glucosamine dehydrogenase
MKFLPGPGLGGHCIPIDPHYLAWKMRSLNYKTRFIDLAGELNSEMPLFWVRKLMEMLNDHGKAIKGAKVLVLGVAYKKDIEDLRESPALDILVLLHQYGAKVAYHDPYVPKFSEGGHDYKSVPLDAKTLADVDAVLVVTDHTSIDWPLVKRASKLLVDTRHVIANLP